MEHRLSKKLIYLQLQLARVQQKRQISSAFGGTFLSTTSVDLFRPLRRRGPPRHLEHTSQRLRTATSLRCLSSRSRGNKQGNNQFKLDGLPFSISPEQALDKFRSWAEDENGLRWLLSYDKVRIGAAFVPCYAFDINLKFEPKIPSMFQDAYSSKNKTIHIGGLTSYAGYSYRRSLLHPVHATSLVFLKDQLEPFGAWMLRDMILQDSGLPISVIPDAWNTTQGRSLALLKNEFQSMMQAEFGEDGGASVKTQVVRSQRVMLPTYVIEYDIFGLQYQAFVSGCDEAAPVSGISHKVVDDTMLQNSNAATQQALQFFGNTLVPIFRRTPQLFIVFGRFLMLALARVYAMIPIVGIGGGLFAGFRKILGPWLEHRTASAEWEREREYEQGLKEEFYIENDFVDRSGAEAYFVRNKSNILFHLGGGARQDQQHQQGSYDWYNDWQEWARQQWEKQNAREQQYSNSQQQHQYGNSSRRQQQRQRTQRQQRQSPPKQDYKWDFDPNDPYSILGIPRGSSKSEVAAAFRKQMLQHHPDTQPNASEAQKMRAVERSKYITEAYRKIKAEMKR